jgi:hypothetical protein
MGYYNGKHIPEYYDPWWEERENITEHEAFYFLGFEDGREDASQHLRDEERKKYELRIEQLENLISANVRTIKAELKAEMEKTNGSSS